ncbi:asparaginase [bacterium]|nr:asparaginase [bacterium]
MKEDCSKKKKILLISTGGTIAMGGDPRAEGVIPVLKGADLMKMLPPFNENISVIIHEYGEYPSPYITISNMLEIRDVILRNYDKYCGFVITHGTDTLEETAYFLDITLPKGKAVVLTAAMRSAQELGLDGPRNIYSAIRAVACRDAGQQKVMVVMNDDIYDAHTVTKIDTSNISSFSSMYLGILGLVDTDRVIFFRRRHIHEFYDVKKINENIPIIKTYAGSDSSLIECAVKSSCVGIVIEALGRGNVPPAVVPGIKAAIKAKIPVVIVSRTSQGRVLGVYGYRGGGKDLSKMGCIFAGALSGQKARIKLAVLLSLNYTQKRLIRKFADD